VNSSKVSIVITTDNRPKLLERALTSALGQSYGNLEIHIVDGGSSQETRENIQRIASSRRDLPDFFEPRASRAWLVVMPFWAVV